MFVFKPLCLFLEQTENNSTENVSESEMKAKEYYKSCLDMDAINKLGPKPLIELLQQVLYLVVLIKG